MVNKIKFKTIVLVLLLIISFGAFAQDDPPVDDGGADDFPATPIDDYILPMALVGIAASGYWLIKKRKTDLIEQNDQITNR